MSNVLVYERASGSFAAALAKRGHHIVYRTNETNRCPGCGRSNWYVGRTSAECGFCGTAVPLAEASRSDGSTVTRSVRLRSEDQRQHRRLTGKGRKLRLLVDGSPQNFAVHNISEGGVAGIHDGELAVGTEVRVRFEGGVLVPAVVRWVEKGHFGLAFTDPIDAHHVETPH